MAHESGTRADPRTPVWHVASAVGVGVADEVAAVSAPHVAEPKWEGYLKDGEWVEWPECWICGRDVYLGDDDSTWIHYPETTKGPAPPTST